VLPFVLMHCTELHSTAATDNPSNHQYLRTLINDFANVHDIKEGNLILEAHILLAHFTHPHIILNGSACNDHWNKQFPLLAAVSTNDPLRIRILSTFPGMYTLSVVEINSRWRFRLQCHLGNNPISTSTAFFCWCLNIHLI
jgi:hypothetical protein